jgi:hypothetical protein
VLQLLFPDNFPTIYATFGQVSGKGISANFREFVHGRQFTKKEVVKMIGETDSTDSSTETNKPRFSQVISTLKKVGIPFYFDKNKKNYMKSDDGREMYVDTFNFRGWTVEMKNNLISYMREKRYSDNAIRLAEAYAERLILMNKKVAEQTNSVEQ